MAPPTPLEAIAIALGKDIVEALINNIGVEEVLRVIFSGDSRDKAIEVLRAEYIADDALYQALKRAKFGPPPTEPAPSGGEGGGGEAA